MKTFFDKWFVRRSKVKETSENNLGWPESVEVDLVNHKLWLYRGRRASHVVFDDVHAVRLLGDVVHVITNGGNLYVQSAVWQAGQTELPFMDRVNRVDYINPRAVDAVMGNTLFINGVSFHCSSEEALARIMSSPLSESSST